MALENLMYSAADRAAQRDAYDKALRAHHVQAEMHARQQAMYNANTPPAPPAERPRDPNIVDAEFEEVADVPLLGPPVDKS